MNLLPMERLGPRVVSANSLRFGLFLPWISAQAGYRLFIKLIHEKDQFLQEIRPASVELVHSVDDTYGDYWSTELVLDPRDRPHPSSSWGLPGTYVYRFELQRKGAPPIDWIVDPYAREFGVGKLSAFTFGYQDHVWSEHEAGWKTPGIDELVVYELMIHEFGGSIDGCIRMLDYLQDLGVNCLEVMPVSNVALVQDWGFLPIGLFGVDERFGNRKDFQRFVDEAHQRNIAVILDAVYGHTSSDFPYQYVYASLGFAENPFMGPFAKDYFGCSTDFRRKLTRDFYYTVNYHWLDAYHVDGFRYDCVPNYYVGPTGDGYADLVHSTYHLVKAQLTNGKWQRFADDDGTVSLIQCAEQLEGPEDIVENTYSNASWQNETLAAAQRVAAGDRQALADLGVRLGLAGYPSQVTMNQDTIRKTAFQYLENHDHERFICSFGMKDRDDRLLAEGDRSRWFKLQPYLIGLLMSKGTPMLWQGQELCENYYVPNSGFGRVVIERPVRWDFFYDEIGRNVLDLVRRLLKTRRRGRHLQSGSHFFYNHWERYQSKGLLLFSRYDEQAFSLVALNFSDESAWAPFWFPASGTYREEIHGQDNLSDVVAYEERWLEIPSNYGRVWTKITPDML